MAYVKGDMLATCAVCGVEALRSTMVRARNGNVVCKRELDSPFSDVKRTVPFQLDFAITSLIRPPRENVFSTRYASNGLEWGSEEDSGNWEDAVYNADGDELNWDQE